MRSTLVSGLLLASSVQALELSIAKKTWAEFGDNIPPSLLRKRVSGSGVDSTNPYQILTYSHGGAYYANVTIGTPPQTQVVVLDTGSSDTYFDASDAPACQSTTGVHSCRGGTFSPSNSSTYKVVADSPAFNASYGDGSTAVGPYATDNLGIGDVVLEGMQFGVAEQVSSGAGYALGLVGIGYSAIEAVGVDGDDYPNVPEVLQEAGVINSRLYSVYLNDAVYGSGTILFGGVDTSKYTGSMTTLDLLPDPKSTLVRQMITTITDVSVSVGGKSTTIFTGGTDGVSAYTSSNKAIAALLDTGSAAWTVPSRYFDYILSAFTYVSTSTLNTPCSNRWSGDSLTLTFGGKQKIVVTAQEFIIPLYNSTTNQAVTDSKGNPMCTFLISPSDDYYVPAGDAVLRSMYVVYDLDNGQVSIAQAVANSTAPSNVVVVPSGTAGVAGVVSGVATAKAQPSVVASQVIGSVSVGVSTLASAIGTATGADAVPTAARPVAGGVDGRSVSLAASFGWAMLMTVGGAVLLI